MQSAASAGEVGEASALPRTRGRPSDPPWEQGLLAVGLQTRPCPSCLGSSHTRAGNATGGHLVQNFLLTAVWIPCEHLQTQTQGPAHPHRVRPQGNAAQGSAFPKSLPGVCCRQVLMRGASIQGTSHPLGGDSSRLWQRWEEGCLRPFPGQLLPLPPARGHGLVTLSLPCPAALGPRAGAGVWKGWGASGMQWSLTSDLGRLHPVIGWSAQPGRSGGRPLGAGGAGEVPQSPRRGGRKGMRPLWPPPPRSPFPSSSHVSGCFTPPNWRG